MCAYMLTKNSSHLVKIAYHPYTCPKCMACKNVRYESYLLRVCIRHWTIAIPPVVQDCIATRSVLHLGKTSSSASLSAPTRRLTLGFYITCCLKDFCQDVRHPQEPLGDLHEHMFLKAYPPPARIVRLREPLLPGAMTNNAACHSSVHTVM